MVEKARLEESEYGLTAVTDGWFVVNVRDGPWVTNATFGDACIFEGEDAPFADLGFTLGVLRPGQPSGLYHREANQEDFLVLSGEAVLIVEGEERPLRAWDFVHCPANTKHVIVGAGSAPCVVLAVGARDRSVDNPDWGGYTVDEVALRHGAGVEQETTKGEEAYAGLTRRQPTRYRPEWLGED